MKSKEEILAYIEQIKAKEEVTKVYGEGWELRDWKTRRSMTAGKLCLIMRALDQAETKAKRRPGSIGARKAKQKAKEYRRQIRSLETVLAESYSDYCKVVMSPQHISTWAELYFPSPSRKSVITKKCINTSCYAD